jgi:hypothetical protein
LIRIGTLWTAGDHDGSIAVDGDYSAGVIAVTSTTVALDGIIVVGGDCGGQIQCGNDLVGGISISGSLLNGSPADPEIDIGGSIDGNVTIGGDCAGQIRCGSSLAGRILVDGSLLNNNSTAPDIDIAGSVTSTGAVAIDYDGWDSNDVWITGATIALGAEPNSPFGGNWPDLHLWEISNCRGDMNNDWAVDYYDINPFVDALTARATYIANFPGLDGSLDWHGDCYADGEFGYEDINAFVELVTHYICDPDGWQGGEEFRGGGDKATAFATLLDTYVTPERHEALLEVVAGAAEYYAEDAELGPLWDDVYALLSE